MFYVFYRIAATRAYELRFMGVVVCHSWQGAWPLSLNCQTPDSGALDMPLQCVWSERGTSVLVLRLPGSHYAQRSCEARRSANTTPLNEEEHMSHCLRAVQLCSRRAYRSVLYRFENQLKLCLLFREHLL
jgi:hypothetical protein